MPLGLPFPTFTPGTKIKASEVTADLAAIQAKFSEGAGGVVDADCSTAMDLNSAVKLSSTAGRRIINGKLEDDAVDVRVLKDDPAPGSPLAAVGLAAQVKDGILTKLKHSTLAGEKLTLAQLDILVEEVAFAISFGGVAVGGLVSASGWRKTSGANYIGRVIGATNGGFLAAADVSPTTPIPFATRNLVAFFITDVVVNLIPNPNRLEGKAVFVSMPLT